MPSRQVYLSGKMVAEEDAKISIFDSAVLLGDTVTESTRTFAHKPFKLAGHIDRLYKSLKVTRIDAGCDAAEMLQITTELLQANLPLYQSHEDCLLVPNISRGVIVAVLVPTDLRSSATVLDFPLPMDSRRKS